MFSMIDRTVNWFHADRRLIWASEDGDFYRCRRLYDSRHRRLRWHHLRRRSLRAAIRLDLAQVL